MLVSFRKESQIDQFDFNKEPHDPRHSDASITAIGGMSLSIIGALLGHTQPTTTHRYAHLSSDPLTAATDAIGERIAAAMNASETLDNVIPVSIKRGK